MKTLSIGWTFDHERVTSADFSSTTSCFDFDIVYWSPRWTVAEYQILQEYLGLPALTERDSAIARADTDRRRAEFADMLRLGRTLVVSTSPHEECYIDTGERTHSGTGKNRATTRMVQKHDFLSALPAPPLSMRTADGENLAFRGGEPLAAFWRANISSLHYEAYFEDGSLVGTPWLFVKGTDRVVGTYLVTPEGGLLLFIPPIIGHDDPRDADLLDREYRFVESLHSLVRDLREAEAGDYSLPTWSERYVTSDEERYGERIARTTEKLSVLEAELASADSELATVQSWKLLWTGTGDALESAVAKAFEQLGCTVSKGPTGEDDLIVSRGEEVAVVEVKGVSGSAAEKHAAQLEKWASRYLEDTGAEAKPILVVNTFRDIPLGERIGISFPDQMLKYAERRNHCLITGLQLFGVYLAAAETPDRTEELWRSIVECVGRYPHFSDWTEFISEQPIVKSADIGNGTRGPI